MDLNQDSFLHVVENMEYNDITALCSTNKQFRNFCSDNENWIWSMLLKRDFGVQNPRQAYKSIQLKLFNFELAIVRDLNGEILPPNVLPDILLTESFTRHIRAISADEAFAAWWSLALKYLFNRQYSYKIKIEELKCPTNRTGLIDRGDEWFEYSCTINGTEPVIHANVVRGNEEWRHPARSLTLTTEQLQKIKPSGSLRFFDGPRYMRR